MQARREALVEAEEERPIALARQPAGLLGGQHRLAAAGGPDDLQAADAPGPIEDELLLVARGQQLGPVVLDPAADEAVQRPGGGEDLVDGGGRAGRAESPSSRRRPSERRRARPSGGSTRRLERLGVEDELARGVGAQEDVAARQARQVDVGQGDRVAGARLLPRRPVGQGLELADQLVLAVLAPG